MMFFIAMRGVPEGLRYIDGVLTTNPTTVDEDEGVSKDVLSARLITDIVNSFEADIKMTYDAPSKNSNGRMPVLDVVILCERNQLLFSFYEKAMTSQFVIMKNSALSWLVEESIFCRGGSQEAIEYESMFGS